MEKNRAGMSWFTLVIKAFKSPNKDNPEKKGTKRRENENEDQEDQKKVAQEKYDDHIFSFFIIYFISCDFSLLLL